ncbi:unnamed protein product [Parnassius apollo]|uniref:(apollo) hypothetical protein n=1 Tax=Parnassius apollo TaxID=110799 RepID=A0A8S3XGT7_PARAO|nr:unnamed protein product [Parnassius apollo]
MPSKFISERETSCCIRCIIMVHPHMPGGTAGGQSGGQAAGHPLRHARLLVAGGNLLAASIRKKYQENELLWNPRHMDFKNRNKRNDAIRDIASVFNIASSEIERKLKNLSSHYFREKRKYEESKKSGSGREDVQLPKWFAYKALSFLNDKNSPVPTLNSHTSKSSQDNITPQTTLPSTRTSRKRNIEIDPEVDEALQLLREITSDARQRDDAAIFADYIGSKLRKMDRYTMCTVQHQIQTIVYEAEMRMGSMYFDRTNNTTQPLRYQNVRPKYFTGQPTTSAMSPSPSTSRSYSVQTMKCKTAQMSTQVTVCY